jgi:hypothetical protein
MAKHLLVINSLIFFNKYFYNFDLTLITLSLSSIDVVKGNKRVYLTALTPEIDYNKMALMSAVFLIAKSFW